MNWQNILIGGVVGVPALLPSILQLQEAIHPRKTGGPSTGPTKFGAAINLAQTALIIAAGAGAIPIQDAQNLAAITALVQKTVMEMKTGGMLGGMKGVPVEAVTDHTEHLTLPVVPIDGSVDGKQHQSNGAPVTQPVSNTVQAALAISIAKAAEGKK